MWFRSDRLLLLLGIRYFAVLEGTKAVPTNYATCCESQGTRTYGALPEFIYSAASMARSRSVADSGTGEAGGTASTSRTGPTVYVNLFVPSVYHGDGFKVVQTTGFPSNGTVSLMITKDGGEGERGMTSVQIMLRIPSWCTTPTVPVTVTPAHVDGAPALPTRTRMVTLAGKRGTYLPIHMDVTTAPVNHK